jgi:small subunit ribosomal protein S17
MSFERRKARVGRVISDKMDKSVVVLVEWRRTHPLYRKSIRRRSRLVVHDADNSCRTGDLIRIIESRPISKTKRWRVAEILSRQEIAEIQPDEITIDQAVATAAGVQEPEAVEPVSEPVEAEQVVSEESEPEQMEAEQPEPEQSEPDQPEAEESEAEQVVSEESEAEHVEALGEAHADPDEGKRSG